MYNFPWVIKLPFIETYWSKNNVVGILSRLGDGRPQNRVRIAAGARDFSSQPSGWRWVRPGRTGGISLAVKWAGCDAVLLPLSSCEIKVAYSYTSTPPRTIPSWRAPGKKILLLRRSWITVRDL